MPGYHCRRRRKYCHCHNYCEKPKKVGWITRSANDASSHDRDQEQIADCVMDQYPDCEIIVRRYHTDGVANTPTPSERLQELYDEGVRCFVGPDSSGDLDSLLALLDTLDGARMVSSTSNGVLTGPTDKLIRMGPPVEFFGRHSALDMQNPNNERSVDKIIMITRAGSSFDESFADGVRCVYGSSNRHEINMESGETLPAKQIADHIFNAGLGVDRRDHLGIVLARSTDAKNTVANIEEAERLVTQRVLGAGCEDDCNYQFRFKVRYNVETLNIVGETEHGEWLCYDNHVPAYDEKGPTYLLFPESHKFIPAQRKYVQALKYACEGFKRQCWPERIDDTMFDNSGDRVACFYTGLYNTSVCARTDLVPKYTEYIKDSTKRVV